jgi:hypothetical protein
MGEAIKGLLRASQRASRGDSGVLVVGTGRHKKAPD